MTKKELFVAALSRRTRFQGRFFVPIGIILAEDNKGARRKARTRWPDYFVVPIPWNKVPAKYRRDAIRNDEFVAL